MRARGEVLQVGDVRKAHQKKHKESAEYAANMVRFLIARFL